MDLFAFPSEVSSITTQFNIQQNRHSKDQLQFILVDTEMFHSSLHRTRLATPIGNEDINRKVEMMY